MYTLFSRPHLDYGDVIYDQPNNESLNKKIEIQWTLSNLNSQGEFEFVRIMESSD